MSSSYVILTLSELLPSNVTCRRAAFLDAIEFTMVANNYPEGRAYIRYVLDDQAIQDGEEVISYVINYMKNKLFNYMYTLHGNGD